MRRSLLLLTTLLVLSQMFSVGPSASAQGASRDPAQVIENCVPGRPPTPAEEELVLQGLAVDWEGVCRPVVWDSAGPRQAGIEAEARSFAVGFRDEFSSAPMLADTEFQVVVVREGTFSLHMDIATPGDFVIYAAGSEIPIMEPIPGTPYYADTGEVLRDADAVPCIIACVIASDMAVKLRPGDRVVSTPGAQCLYCNIGRNSIRDGEVGVLEVFPIPTATAVGQFSWIVSFDEYQSRAATPAADASPAMGWAFFQSSTRCRGGRN